MGMGDLVVQTDDEYVALAVKLVQDPAYRAEVKRRIVMARDVLFDDTAPIRALEDFLLSAVRRGPAGT